jgi:hypothetical protein
MLRAIQPSAGDARLNLERNPTKSVCWSQSGGANFYLRQQENANLQEIRVSEGVIRKRLIPLSGIIHSALERTRFRQYSGILIFVDSIIEENPEEIPLSGTFLGPNLPEREPARIPAKSCASVS